MHVRRVFALPGVVAVFARMNRSGRPRVPRDLCNLLRDPVGADLVQDCRGSCWWTCVSACFTHISLVTQRCPSHAGVPRCSVEREYLWFVEPFELPIHLTGIRSSSEVLDAEKAAHSHEEFSNKLGFVGGKQMCGDTIGYHPVIKEDIRNVSRRRLQSRNCPSYIRISEYRS